MRHEQAREQHDRQAKVEHRPHHGDYHALPARFRHEVAVVGGRLAGVLARHLHEATERQEADLVVRLAPPEPEQPRTEPEGKRFHLDVEIPRGQEVAQFVNQDHHAQHEDEADYVNEVVHLGSVWGGWLGPGLGSDSNAELIDHPGGDLAGFAIDFQYLSNRRRAASAGFLERPLDHPS